MAGMAINVPTKAMTENAIRPTHMSLEIQDSANWMN